MGNATTPDSRATTGEPSVTPAVLEEVIRERDALVAQLSAVMAKLGKLERDCAEYQKLVHLLQEANEKLKRGLLGQKAERLPPDAHQLSLAFLKQAFESASQAATNDNDDKLPSSASEAAKQRVAEHERRKPVRKPLPENLPRVPVEIVPEEVKRQGLDAFERIGEDAREVLERRPASAVVVRLIYPKFVRKDRSENSAAQAAEVTSQQEVSPDAVAAAACSVLAAPAVELPIERGVAGPTLLADTIVRRWDLLFRQVCPERRARRGPGSVKSMAGSECRLRAGTERRPNSLAYGVRVCHNGGDGTWERGDGGAGCAAAIPQPRGNRCGPRVSA